VRNANDGISMLQTAEGATKEITNMLQRMRELAVQGANDTYGSADRASLGLEFDALTTEIDRIANSTEWNGMKILDGSSMTSAKLQIGTGSGTAYQIEVTFDSMTAASLDSDLATGAITSASTAGDFQGMLTTLDAAITYVDDFRANMGATINRLNYAADNMSNTSLNTAASRSRIEDTDFAAATTELARTQIISQAATAMLAQANQQPQGVLSLLR